MGGPVTAVIGWTVTGLRATLGRVITCRPVAVDSADATALLRAYLTELVDRYYGRPMPVERVDEALAESPSDDLPFFLVAYRDMPTAATTSATATAGGPAVDAAVGCVGLRPLGPSSAEVKRLFVVPHARRLGVGVLLLDALEAHARATGVTELRLDTRGDLVEARALYTRHGYVEIPAYNDEKYAEHWFAKRLAAGPDAVQTPRAYRSASSR